MQSPTIVAIIPLYNGARFIEQAVTSVLTQSRPPDECLVVDDGSSDAGPEIVARMAETRPVRLLRKPNGGQSSARNHGVAHARSSLVAFLDQDDAWYPDHLARLVAPFMEGPSDRLGWTYSDLDEGDETGRLLTSRFLRTRAATHPKTSVAACLREDMYVLPSASLISRAAFEAVNGFDERLMGYEDDDLFIRILDCGYENVFIDEPLSLWRIYAHSTSYSPLMVRSRMIFARKALQTFGPRRVDDGTLATTAIAPRFTRTLFGEYARAGRRNDRDGMDSALDDIRDVTLPHLRPGPAMATRLAVMLLRFHRLGRFVTGPWFVALVRRVLGLSADHRAAGLQAEADRPHG